MSSAVEVRALTDSDLPTAIALWDELAADPDAPPFPPPVEQLVATVKARWAASAASEAAGGAATYRLLGAFDEDGGLVGLLSLTVAEQSLFESSSVLVMEGIHVLASCRDRGIGRAMLAAASAFALSIGARDIVVNTPAQSRAVNRFFAKWGFAPTSVRRSAPAEDLARLLGQAGADSSRDPEASQFQRLLRRRAVIGARTLRTPRVAR